MTRRILYIYSLFFVAILFSCQQKDLSLKEIKSLKNISRSICLRAKSIFDLKLNNEKNNIEMIEYKDVVPNIFFHSLIAQAPLAFDFDKDQTYMNDWFITVSEFDAILTELYQRNYVLVSIYDTFEYKDVNGKRIPVIKPVLVPKGKTPLIISVDDLNYYATTQRNGTISSLFVDDTDGMLKSKTKQKDGTTLIGTNDDVPLVLENFIAKHPDFSIRNARGIIALTGYTGFFGLDIINTKNALYKQNTEMALRVALRLKSMGWVFASHSWNHVWQAKTTDEVFIANEKKWSAIAKDIIGNTDLYIFPFGDPVFSYEKRYKALQELGFSVFFTVNAKAIQKQIDNCLVYGRVPIDGKGIEKNSSSLLKYITIKNIISPERIEFLARKEKKSHQALATIPKVLPISNNGNSTSNTINTNN